MCLYDGFNANSTQYSVTLKDEGKAAEGRASGDFSLYRNGGEVGPLADRIDYHVQLQSPDGQWQAMHNNQQVNFDNIHLSRIRPVRLPGIRTPVLCVPAPLKLIVDRFRMMDKTQGYYKGVLTVLFSANTPTVD